VHGGFEKAATKQTNKKQYCARTWAQVSAVVLQKL
jgi:hypothetical protein